MISVSEITDAWKNIQVSDKNQKFYKLVYINSKTKIRASIKRDENLKAIEFIFPKSFFSKSQSHLGLSQWISENIPILTFDPVIFNS